MNQYGDETLETEVFSQLRQGLRSRAGGVFVNLQGEPTDPFRPEVTIVARGKNVAMEIIALADSFATVG